MKTITFYTATWCIFCKRLKPHVDKIAADAGIEIEYIDIDDNPELAQQLEIKTIPTLYVGGERLVNPTPAQVLRALK